MIQSEASSTAALQIAANQAFIQQVCTYLLTLFRLRWTFKKQEFFAHTQVAGDEITAALQQRAHAARECGRFQD